jgi:GNAT superfamily N-acetyltransferase
MLLREAEPGDALGVAQVHVRAWQLAYRGLLPDEYLDSLRPEDWAARYTLGSAHGTLPRTVVALENDFICGFATTAPAYTAVALHTGELCALYVDPAHWGRGVGVKLIKAARAQLAEQGFDAAILWVLVGNLRALRFYQADGWTADGAQRMQELWGVIAPELRLRRML